MLHVPEIHQNSFPALEDAPHRNSCVTPPDIYLSMMTDLSQSQGTVFSHFFPQTLPIYSFPPFP